MRQLNEIETEMVSGSGNAYGKYNPKNPHYDPNATPPDNLPNGIARKQPAPEGEGSGA